MRQQQSRGSKQNQREGQTARVNVLDQPINLPFWCFLEEMAVDQKFKNKYKNKIEHLQCLAAMWDNLPDSEIQRYEDIHAKQVKAHKDFFDEQLQIIDEEANEKYQEKLKELHQQEEQKEGNQENENDKGKPRKPQKKGPRGKSKVSTNVIVNNLKNKAVKRSNLKLEEISQFNDQQQSDDDDILWVPKSLKLQTIINYYQSKVKE